MDDQIFATIEAQAQESAKMLLDVGWDPTGERYDLGVYRGDLERSIRLHLGGPSR